MTFTLLVSGFESAGLALKLKVLTGASLSVRVAIAVVFGMKAHCWGMESWSVQARLALLPLLQAFQFLWWTWSEHRSQCSGIRVTASLYQSV